MLYPTDLTRTGFDKYIQMYHGFIQDFTYMRLDKKPQVLTFPKYKFLTTRLSHTKRVEINAWILANLTGLNSSMCSCIAAGHDLGHPPYGHAGEHALRKLTDGRFRHAFFSPLVIEEVANKGKGIEINDYVREGIINHSNGGTGFERKEGIIEENNVILFSDKTYILSDVFDILTLKEKGKEFSHLDIDYKKLQIPQELFKTKKLVEQEQKLLHLISIDSLIADKICFTNPDYTGPLNELFSYMYSEVYPFLDKAQHSGQLEEDIFTIYEAIKRSDDFRPYPTIPTIALLTDPEARAIANRLKENKSKKLKLEDINDLQISRILPYIEEKEFELPEPTDSKSKK